MLFLLIIHIWFIRKRISKYLHSFKFTSFEICCSMKILGFYLKNMISYWNHKFCIKRVIFIKRVEYSCVPFARVRTNAIWSLFLFFYFYTWNNLCYSWMEVYSFIKKKKICIKTFSNSHTRAWNSTNLIFFLT